MVCIYNKRKRSGKVTLSKKRKKPKVVEKFHCREFYMALELAKAVEKFHFQ